MAKKAKSKAKEEIKEEKVESGVFEVPNEIDFANNLVEMFLKENGLRLGDEETGRPLEVILTVPEIHTRFTIWLCNFLYRTTFEENGAPEGVTLN